MRVFPWILAGLSAAVAVYLLVGQSPPERAAEAALVSDGADAGSGAATTAGPAAPGTGGRTATSECPPCEGRAPGGDDGQCPVRLESARAALAHCLSEASTCSCSPEADLGACLAIPAVREQIDRAPDQVHPLEAEVSECLESDRLRESRYHTLRTLFEEDLELLPEEVEWLAEFACALRELRWAAVAVMHDDGVDAGEVREMMLGERRDVLKDIETFLDTGTYARFRQMGGIGLLNDTLDCHDELVR